MHISASTSIVEPTHRSPFNPGKPTCHTPSRLTVLSATGPTIPISGSCAGTSRRCSCRTSVKQGALFGSGVIIPVRHAETVFDLTLDEVSATFQLLAEVKRWMDATYRPQGYNVGWNCGAVGGQDVMHAHMHVIPRFEQEPYAGRGIRYWLKQEPNRWR